MDSGEQGAPLQDYDYFAKVVILGSATVGKSSLLLRFTQNLFPETYSCTLGVDYQTKTLEIEGKRVKLQIWDTAGQERFTPMAKCYLRNTTVCIIVFDITNRDSFHRVSSWVSEFLEANTLSQPHSLFIVGNKFDCADTRTVSTKEALQLCESFAAKYVETSAKTGYSVDQLFTLLATDVYEKRKGKGDLSDRSSAKMRLKTASERGENKGKICC